MRIQKNVLVLAAALLLIFSLIGEAAHASTCGYPNGPKTGKMVADVNEWKSCSTMASLSPPGLFWMKLSNMPSGSPLTSGMYGSYCVDLSGTILDNPQQGNIEYTVDFWSSLDPNLPNALKVLTYKDPVTSIPVTNTIPWEKINYLINAFPNESWLNLQGAFWNLVHGCTQSGPLYDCKPLLTAPNYFPFGPGAPYGCPGTPTLVDEARVQFLVSEAHANGTGFIPQGGQRIASVGQITNCTPSTICNQYLPYQVFFIPSTCPTCTGSIGDRIWKDLNGNGIQDVDPVTGHYTEPGMPGVEVRLTGKDAYGQAISLSTTTDADGNYRFTSICSGDYSVSVNETTVSAGMAPTINRSVSGDDNNPKDSNEPSGTQVSVTTDSSANLTVDFGYVPECKGSIGNYVWKDIPGSNGVQDAGELGIPGVTLALAGINVYGVAVNMSTTTVDGSGAYSFDGLCQGSYSVKVVAGVPAGFSPTQWTSSNGDDLVGWDSNNPENTTVSLVSDNDSNQTVDFGYVPNCRGMIGDYVWKDYNGNGYQDIAELDAGIPGAQVTLSGTNAYGQLVTMTEPADATGRYTFDGVCAGKYTVTVNPSSIPAGWIPTVNRSTDGNDGIGNDSNEPKGTVVVAADDVTDISTVDFGYAPDCKGEIGNVVWEDRNGNGVQDEGTSAGIDGIQILLTGHNLYGQPVSLVDFTKNGGYYAFTGLCQGDYTVAINATSVPSGFVPTSPRSSSGNDGKEADSNEHIATTVTLVSDTASNMSVDFGYYRPAVIGDFVWEDRNGNGIQDAGEPGIGGATATLYECATGTSIASTTTTPGGTYSFTVAPGSYYVVFSDLPAGYVFTMMNAPGSTAATDSNADTTGRTDCITVVSGDSDLTIDAGVYKPAVIGDYVWEDRNGNGNQDAGEPGVGGVTATLYDCTTAKVIATTTTDANGSYLFTVVPGNYYVVFSGLPAGYAFTTKNAPGSTDATDSNADTTGRTDCITVVSGDSDLTIDAGVYKPAVIGDYVWEDRNGNGNQDAGELGIAGVTVTLYDCTTGKAVATTTTDANGSYQFTVVPGSYYVVFSGTPAGYAFTMKNAPGSTDATDSNADTTGRTDCITVVSGETNITIDAGVYKPAVIGDYVWDDRNGNGAQDAGELGIAGVTVTLNDCTTGKVVATTTTDANGSYQFTVVPGSYYVVFSGTPAGYAFTMKNAPGSTTATDSNADTTGRTDCITIASGESNLTIDAGLFKPLPKIDIRKQAEGPDSRTFAAGSSVTFFIAVTNIGNVDLSDVTVSDVQSPDCARTIGILGVGSTSAYLCTVSGTTRSFTNTACVEGKNGGMNVSDCDDSTVYIPTIDIRKQAEGPDSRTFPAGSPVPFEITVTNTGVVPLTGVVVTDALVPGCGTTIGSLNPGQSFVYTCTAPNVTSGFTNTACVEGYANGVKVSDCDNSSVAVDSYGCTFTIGYWKNHSGFGPQSDVVSPLLPQYLGTVGGAKSMLVDSTRKVFDILNQNVYGTSSNGITKLYAQLLAAKLNIKAGADPAVVSGIIASADAFLAGYDYTSWSTLKSGEQNKVLGWAAQLDSYNNGASGPGHCGSQETVPCVDIMKKISVDGGSTWLDADTQDTAPVRSSSFLVKYKLLVNNCGTIDLTNVDVDDPVLGINNYVIPSLTAGATTTLTSAQIPQLAPSTKACMTSGKFENVATATAAVSGVQVSASDSAWLVCDVSTSCLDITKDISIDGGVTWKPADTQATAPTTTAPHSADYRLTVKNCGSSTLNNVTVQDAYLGITGYTVGTLYSGTYKVLTSRQIPALRDADACTVAGSFSNTAIASATYNGLPLKDSDVAWLTCTGSTDTGCSYTWGYWKTHTGYDGSKKRNSTWDKVGGENAMFFETGQTWYGVLMTDPSGGSAYYILAHQYIAAYLNRMSGASTSVIDGDLKHAEQLLSTYDGSPRKMADITGNVREDFIATAAKLDQYNNGIIGPGHCK